MRLKRSLLVVTFVFAFSILIFSFLLKDGYFSSNPTESDSSKEQISGSIIDYGNSGVSIVEVFTDTPYYVDVSDLIGSSTHIISCTLTDIKVERIDILDYSKVSDEFYNPSGVHEGVYHVFTVYTFSVNRCFKGDMPEGNDTVEVKVFGGCIDDVMYINRDTIEFSDYETQYILFLHEFEDVPFDLVNPVQGAYVLQPHSTDSMSNEFALVRMHEQNSILVTYDDLLGISNGDR